MPFIGSIVPSYSQLSGSTAAGFDSKMGLSGSLAVHYDGASSDDGFIQFTEVAATANAGTNKGRLYCKDDSDTTKLYFRSGSTETDLLAGGGTDRYTVSNRFYNYTSMNATNRAYFVRDTLTYGEQFLFYSTNYVANAVTGSAIIMDSAFLTGLVSSGQFVAPRDCTLTNISGVGQFYGNDTSGSFDVVGSGLNKIRMRVWKVTLTNNEDNLVKKVATAIGQADFQKNALEDLVRYNVYNVNQAITSSNSISAGDVAIISIIPVGAPQDYAHTNYPHLFNITLEFTPD